MSIITNSLNALDKKLERIRERNATYLSLQDKYNLELAYYRQAQQEYLDTREALQLLEDSYSQLKESSRNELADNITNILNTSFYNNYDFYLDYNEKDNTCKLKDRYKPGSVYRICGDGAMQTIGVVTNLSLLRKHGSSFLFLDEAFSNYGVKEIAQLPSFLNKLTDMQLVLIEHKEQLVDNEALPSLRVILIRDLDKGTYIKSIEDPNNELEEIEKYIDMCERMAI